MKGPVGGHLVPTAAIRPHKPPFSPVATEVDSSMGKKRSRRPVVEDEEEKMALEEEEELELELRAAREIMREKMEAGEVPEGFRHLVQMGDDSDDEDGGKGSAPGPPVNNQVGDSLHLFTHFHHCHASMLCSGSSRL